MIISRLLVFGEELVFLHSAPQLQMIALLAVLLLARWRGKRSSLQAPPTGRSQPLGGELGSGCPRKSGGYLCSLAMCASSVGSPRGQRSRGLLTLGRDPVMGRQFLAVWNSLVLPVIFFEEFACGQHAGRHVVCVCALSSGLRCV